VSKIEAAEMSRTIVGAAPEARRPRWSNAIFWGGLVAGLLDISDAIITWGLQGVPAGRILQSVASGLLGRASYTGGFATMALGTFLHFLIAAAAAATYVAASTKLPLLVRRAVPCGIAFGVAVYLFMNYLVLPLSAFPGRSSAFSLSAFLHGVIGHAFLVGLPIALLTRKFTSARA
jgi:uncharacterized membrane protein YagU involved in acid resistance